MKLNKNFSFNFKRTSWGLLVVLLATGPFLPACNQRSPSHKQSASVPAMPDFTGTYTLATINGNKLPFIPPHEGGPREVQSGALTLNGDGTVSATTTFRVPSGQVANREVSGTYTRDGDRVNMQWKAAGRTIGTLEGATFTMDNEGILFAYRK